MPVKISRQEILERLRKEVSDKRPIFGAGCSAGIIAKCAELGKADLIIVYSTGKTRMMGLPTTIIGPSNPITLDMADELMNVVKNTPIIAGVEANDPFYLDIEASLKRFTDKGFNGVINFPTVALYENLIEGGMALRKFTENMAHGYGVEHWGWPREVEMVRLLRQHDIFTMAYVFTPADAADMAKAGVDVICVHVGPTMGGLTGFAEMEDLDALLKKSQITIEAARRESPEVICLIHGGPFYDPESTAIIYEKTDAQGFVGASAIERTPVERAVMQTCQGFKNHTLKGRPIKP
ncbi:MAG: phosphoenolpyruvate hydrolase family protein [Candidatus Abyssobacteria bacterium SURF_17]|uniref:Phosphoenolpyruvate hydrolase family protein n=1 Tax=Candidatus Abyssobacteria bacterium SURF_17 TaxID=2093361 RepID=A0A419F6S4_9BACT|nr:MAG: phosphoenolpyruvate hydrolase family protein [Candidatus Abyssubacteria bacterium SURF_17]